VVNINTVVFWAVTLCRSVCGYRCFRETCSLRLRQNGAHLFEEGKLNSEKASTFPGIQNFKISRL
jgi:hypothetical protein